MIAVDANLLLYAHRTAVREHAAARRAIERACTDDRGWGISVASVSEFWGIATHPAATGRPSTASEATRFFRALVDDGRMAIWRPGPGFADRLLQLADDLGVRGVRIFDLQIGLTAFENGAHELWTHDRHFVRIPGLRLRDPLR